MLLITLFWNFMLFWNLPLMICNFLLLFSHSKNIWMSTLITIIITYYLLSIIIIIIIARSHNNYCSVEVMELCLLNLLIQIDFFCVYNSYPCVLFESLSHVINQESHVYLGNLGKIYLIHFFKFWNLPCFTQKKKANLGNLSQICYKVIIVIMLLTFELIII